MRLEVCLCVCAFLSFLGVYLTQLSNLNNGKRSSPLLVPGEVHNPISSLVQEGRQGGTHQVSQRQQPPDLTDHKAPTYFLLLCCSVVTYHCQGKSIREWMVLWEAALDCFCSSFCFFIVFYCHIFLIVSFLLLVFFFFFFVFYSHIFLHRHSWPLQAGHSWPLQAGNWAP